MDSLGAVTELLHGAGATMRGYECSDDEAVIRVHELFPDKSFCLVRDWIWIDLIMPKSVHVERERTAHQDVILYAHQVVLDSRCRFFPGDWIRTSPLIALTDDCFFETGNTVYVLLGNGTRKTAELSTVNMIF